MKPLFYLLFSGMLLSLLGCAGFNQSAFYPGTRQNLSCAGFMPMAMTPEQETFFATLPPNQVTQIERGGNIYYVYPDQEQHQVLMGQPSAMKNYQQLLNQGAKPLAGALSHANNNSAVVHSFRPIRRMGQQFQGYVKNAFKPRRNKHHAISAGNEEAMPQNAEKSIAHLPDAPISNAPAILNQPLPEAGKSLERVVKKIHI